MEKVEEAGRMLDDFVAVVVMGLEKDGDNLILRTFVRSTPDQLAEMFALLLSRFVPVPKDCNSFIKTVVRQYAEYRKQ